MTAVVLSLPFGLGYILRKRPSQEFTLIGCFSLLLLGISLATLSCLNFSLGLITGLLASPLSFIRPVVAASEDQRHTLNDRHALKTMAMLSVLVLGCPNVVIIAASAISERSGLSLDLLEGLRSSLVQASFAWHVNGCWTSVVLWVVWWPAWLAGAVIAASRLFATV